MVTVLCCNSQGWLVKLESVLTDVTSCAADAKLILEIPLALDLAKFKLHYTFMGHAADRTKFYTDTPNKQNSVIVVGNVGTCLDEWRQYLLKFMPRREGKVRKYINFLVYVYMYKRRCHYTFDYHRYRIYLCIVRNEYGSHTVYRWGLKFMQKSQESHYTWSWLIQEYIRYSLP